jgi:DNA recombination protein RmuC
MEDIIYCTITFIVGAIIAALYIDLKSKNKVSALIEKERTKYYELEKNSLKIEATLTSELASAKNTVTELKNSLEVAAKKIENDRNKHDEHTTVIERLKTINQNLVDQLNVQKTDIEELNTKFKIEFENLANKILEVKADKFTEINKVNIKAILDPLGLNIKEFKEQIEKVYDKESKERFSLGEKVKELAELNKAISQEANNLTRALKGEVKTQGRWGEMILESILEKSGLVKDREYFLEHQLKGEDGAALKSDFQDKKMRPDAVIKYPDNRNVIIDSKVSLNAFTRYVEADEAEEQKKELQEHLKSIKSHIDSLSAKGYDDYDKSLDFVMMFIPSEPAYIAALQGDNNIWHYAYDKRILLLSPTNLITSLKLIVDLWKREYQNQNAKEIADRGGKLYDKFVGFVKNLEDIGKHLNHAQNSYTDAYKQLYTGNDNLVTQANKLKSLGLKTKKELPSIGESN